MAFLLLIILAPQDYEKKALERINTHRRLAGLDPVTLDSALSKGCSAHAAYLVRNEGHPSTDGLGAHDENPKLPGYSPEGKKAAGASDIGYQDPVTSVDAWMSGLFHRVPILDPLLKKVGVGYAKGGKWGWVSVLDVVSGRGPGKPRDPVLYPAPKQKDVPLTLGNELPSPVPDDSDKRAGYPVTITFREEVMVKGVIATMQDETGKGLDVWLSTPEHPADSRYQRNTICLIAKDPLRARTTYTITAQGNVAGKRWTKTWTFTTGGR